MHKGEWAGKRIVPGVVLRLRLEGNHGQDRVRRPVVDRPSYPRRAGRPGHDAGPQPQRWLCRPQPRPDLRPARQWRQVPRSLSERPGSQSPRRREVIFAVSAKGVSQRHFRRNRARKCRSHCLRRRHTIRLYSLIEYVEYAKSRRIVAITLPTCCYLLGYQQIQHGFGLCRSGCRHAVTS